MSSEYLFNGLMFLLYNIEDNSWTSINAYEVSMQNMLYNRIPQSYLVNHGFTQEMFTLEINKASYFNKEKTKI
jgi:hypothetical protein